MTWRAWVARAEAPTFSVERRKLMRFLGAKVIITPAAERAFGMVKKAVELADAHGWFLTRQFENEANADFHSQTTAREIIDDFAGERLGCCDNQGGPRWVAHDNYRCYSYTQLLTTPGLPSSP